MGRCRAAAGPGLTEVPKSKGTERRPRGMAESSDGGVSASQGSWTRSGVLGHVQTGLEGTDLASHSHQSPSVTLGARVSLLGGPHRWTLGSEAGIPRGWCQLAAPPSAGSKNQGRGLEPHTPRAEAPLHVGTCSVARNPASAQPCSKEGREGASQGLSLVHRLFRKTEHNKYTNLFLKKKKTKSVLNASFP